VKPARLRWLPTGRVTSQRQRRNGTAGPENERRPILTATGSVNNGISPDSDMEMEARFLFEAADYCDSPTPHSDRAS
jgi:hypothetical protein